MTEFDVSRSGGLEPTLRKMKRSRELEGAGSSSGRSNRDNSRHIKPAEERQVRKKNQVKRERKKKEKARIAKEQSQLSCVITRARQHKNRSESENGRKKFRKRR